MLQVRTLMETAPRGDQRAMLRLVAALILAFLPLSGSAADVLDNVKARNALIVGVKADYVPFGFRDKSGAIVGLEPDLAADAAKQLGVALQFMPVNPANRVDLLQSGQIDLIVATMTDTPERRRTVDFVEPHYYADFTNILMRRDAPIFKWEDLKGKKLCATSAAVHIPAAIAYGASIVTFDGTELPFEALSRGDCLGYIYNQSYIIGKLMDRRVRGEFEMPLLGIIEARWGVAVKKGEDRFKHAIEAIAASWVKSGLIFELEDKWHVPPNAFTMRLREGQH
jgi:polar amino acid transport system substrate-binding protein